MYADSPAQVSTSAFHAGEPVALEQYGGKVTRAPTSSISLDTYDTVLDSEQLLDPVDMLAGVAGIMSLLSAWL